MKIKPLLAALMICILLLAGCASASPDTTTIVTSFYPMYVFAQNIAKDISGVEVRNMADQSAGCLHDYQLQTRDMVTLEGADVLVINGGGMEQFMDKIASMYSDLTVVEASAGIEMMCSVAENHDHAGEAHHHENENVVYNAHVWLNPELAVQQIRAIAQGLSAADEANAQAYQANAEAYIARITSMKDEIAAQLAPYAQEKMIICGDMAKKSFIPIPPMADLPPAENIDVQEVLEKYLSGEIDLICVLTRSR